MKQRCPLCRTPIKRNRTHGLHTLQQTIESLAKEEDEFKTRSRAHEEWTAQVTLEKAEVGELLDVKDTFFVWCVGEVKEVVRLEGDSLLLIHYRGWDSLYDEFIPLSSPRLAPLGTFTNRPELPKHKRRGQLASLSLSAALAVFNLSSLNWDSLAPRW